MRPSIGLGEGGAFDGRFVGFWGAWGEETRTVRLYCADGRQQGPHCLLQSKPGLRRHGRNVGLRTVPAMTRRPVYNSDGQAICYQDKQVPDNQGFFVHDIHTGKTWTVAKTGEDFDDFLYWNFSGMTPCKGSGHSKPEAEAGAEDDGEPARWRSSAFVAVAGKGAQLQGRFQGQERRVG